MAYLSLSLSRHNNDAVQVIKVSTLIQFIIQITLKCILNAVDAMCIARGCIKKNPFA